MVIRPAGWPPMETSKKTCLRDEKGGKVRLRLGIWTPDEVLIE